MEKMAISAVTQDSVTDTRIERMDSITRPLRDVNGEPDGSVSAGLPDPKQIEYVYQLIDAANEENLPLTVRRRAFAAAGRSVRGDRSREKTLGCQHRTRHRTSVPAGHTRARSLRAGDLQTAAAAPNRRGAPGIGRHGQQRQRQAIATLDLHGVVPRYP